MKVEVERSRRGWLRAHWKLVLTIWLGLALSGAAGAFIWLRSSDATKLAIRTAESNPALVEYLGSPLKTGLFVSGNIEVTPVAGHAELAIPISGPKGSGTIYAEARKLDGLWHLENLEFRSKDSTARLNILRGVAVGPPIQSQ
jgi:hypothetical protein